MKRKSLRMATQVFTFLVILVPAAGLQSHSLQSHRAGRRAVDTQISSLGEILKHSDNDIPVRERKGSLIEIAHDGSFGRKASAVLSPGQYVIKSAADDKCLTYGAHCNGDLQKVCVDNTKMVNGKCQDCGLASLGAGTGRQAVWNLTHDATTTGGVTARPLWTIRYAADSCASLATARLALGGTLPSCQSWTKWDIEETAAGSHRWTLTHSADSWHLHNGGLTCVNSWQTNQDEWIFQCVAGGCMST